MNQICALQHPLDSATEALDQQAKDERYVNKAQIDAAFKKNIGPLQPRNYQVSKEVVHKL